MTWNITLRMRRWRDVSDFASQKFRLTQEKHLRNKPRTNIHQHWSSGSGRTVAGKSSIGGFVFAKEAWHWKFNTNFTDLLRFIFQFGGLVLCLGDKPTKAPCGDGTAFRDSYPRFVSNTDTFHGMTTVSSCRYFLVFLLAWGVCEFTQKLSLDSIYCLIFHVGRGASRGSVWLSWETPLHRRQALSIKAYDKIWNVVTAGL